LISKAEEHLHDYASDCSDLMKLKNQKSFQQSSFSMNYLVKKYLKVFLFVNLKYLNTDVATCSVHISQWLVILTMMMILVSVKHSSTIYSDWNIFLSIRCECKSFLFLFKEIYQLIYSSKNDFQKQKFELNLGWFLVHHFDWFVIIQ